jgi:thioredoxin-related protein
LKTCLLNIALFIYGLLLTNSSISAQILLPSYSAWDGFAFENKQAVESRDTEERFARFLLHITQQTRSRQAEQIGELLAAAEENNASARFLTLAEKYLYDPNSPYRNDEQYLLFLQYASEHRLKDYIANSRYQKHYMMVQKNRVGNAATDFAYSTQVGEKGNLYGLQSQYTLLFFHDPNCEECQAIKRYLENNNTAFAQIGVQIVAVYIDEEVDAWRKAQYLPYWLSVYAPDIDKQDLYDIKALPTLYLLDRNKKVLLKDAPLMQIMNFLRS